MPINMTITRSYIGNKTDHIGKPMCFVALIKKIATSCCRSFSCCYSTEILPSTKNSMFQSDLSERSYILTRNHLAKNIQHVRCLLSAATTKATTSSTDTVSLSTYITFLGKLASRLKLMYDTVFQESRFILSTLAIIAFSHFTRIFTFWQQQRNIITQATVEYIKGFYVFIIFHIN